MLFVIFWTIAGNSGISYEVHLHLQPHEEDEDHVTFPDLLRTGHGFATKCMFSYEFWELFPALGFYSQNAVVLD